MRTATTRRTVIAGCATIVAGSIAGCTNDEETPVDGFDDPEERATAEVTQYLETHDANLFGGELDDRTDQTAVRIAVGAGDRAVAFDPAAVRIATGTTVTWEWTGEGGHHNIDPPPDSDLEAFRHNELIEEAGYTHTYTFDEAGSAYYTCETHAAQGMYGGIVVQ